MGNNVCLCEGRLPLLWNVSVQYCCFMYSAVSLIAIQKHKTKCHYISISLYSIWLHEDVYNALWLYRTSCLFSIFLVTFQMLYYRWMISQEDNCLSFLYIFFVMHSSGAVCLGKGEQQLISCPFYCCEMNKTVVHFFEPLSLLCLSHWLGSFESHNHCHPNSD